MVLEHLNVYLQRMNFNLKKPQKYNIDLNVKLKTLNILENNVVFCLFVAISL